VKADVRFVGFRSVGGDLMGVLERESPDGWILREKYGKSRIVLASTTAEFDRKAKENIGRLMVICGGFDNLLASLRPGTNVVDIGGAA
jgi:hypothetical protein